MTDAGAPPGPADDVLGLVRDGQAKFASGDLDEARSAFARALELRPDDAGAKAGLERCERLLAERAAPSTEPSTTPPWPNDGLRSDDFPDSAENPEATVVDPNYLTDIGVVRSDAGSSGEFPEPLTVPLGPALDAADTPKPDPPVIPPRPGEPAYPRYVATTPGNYPEVRKGGRPSVASPPPMAPGTPLPGPAPAPAPVVVAYPQMPPGGPSAYPHYASPVGAYPQAQAQAPSLGPLQLLSERRWIIMLASVGAGSLLLGLLLGWAIFGGSDDDPESKDEPAGTVVPLVTRDAGTSPNTDPSAPAPAQPPGGGAAGATTARVSGIARPIVATVTAPVAGRVLKLHTKAAANVKAGGRLYTIKGGKKARVPEAIVEAPRAGRFEVRAAEGDEVAEGDVVGVLVDPDAWLLVADLTGEAVTPSWHCEVSSGDGVSRSPCRIDSVQRLGGRSRAAARVAVRDAGWIKGDETDLLLTASPP